MQYPDVVSLLSTVFCGHDYYKLLEGCVSVEMSGQEEEVKDQAAELCCKTQIFYWIFTLLNIGSEILKDAMKNIF